jgi:hypothetical protein
VRDERGDDLCDHDAPDGASTGVRLTLSQTASSVQYFHFRQSTLSRSDPGESPPDNRADRPGRIVAPNRDDPHCRPQSGPCHRAKRSGSSGAMRMSP